MKYKTESIDNIKNSMILIVKLVSVQLKSQILE